MRLLITSFVSAILLSGCGEPQSSIITSQRIQASGDFLFEGPNTLSGDLVVSLSAIADSLSISKDDIRQVQLSKITLNVANDSLTNKIESVVVQVVSDSNPLETMGNKNPLKVNNEHLNVNTALNLLPYLQDTGSQLVVDVNLNGDLESLQVFAFFEMKIVY